MMKSYKVQYVNWKGTVVSTYLYANSREEAIKTANVLQGLSVLLEVADETDD